MEQVTEELAGVGITGAIFVSIEGLELFPHAAAKGRSLRGAAGLRFALQESIDQGQVYLYYPSRSRVRWIVALEHKRIIHGAIAGPVYEATGDDPPTYEMPGKANPGGVKSSESIRREGQKAFDVFYDVSEWSPQLLSERRREWTRRLQLAEATRQYRDSNSMDIDSFEKERLLLSYIRAGDRVESRRLLNEMLAAIYLTDPSPVVLRARLIELLSGLTRAAIEDNPLLESLIERNHQWTDRIVHSDDFETLSLALMSALDEFIDAVFLHGANRSNVYVHKALDYIAKHYRESISLREVARHTGLSASRLAHLFKEHTGHTVVETVRQLRIRQAQHLLTHTGMTCAEIGYDVGFSDQSYFILHFRRQTGVTPLRYRRRVSV